MKRAAAALLLLWTGCGRYGDFQLPQAEGAARGAKGFEWQAEAEPVLGRGPEGSWDAVDVLNPSVVRRGGVYYNFYSGFDGRTWHTGMATSRDGVHWAKLGRVISPDAQGWEGNYIAANGSALEEGGAFLYWYQAGNPPRIGLARSRDGKVWDKQARAVLGCGPRGSWDERGVGDPFVLMSGGRYYMYYLGQDRARRQRLGVAMSEDGVNWRKLRTNPVLETGEAGSFDEGGLGEPAVWTADGRYWMLYTGRDRRENRRMGLAWSRDGVRWERVPGAPVLEGGARWSEKVICDAAVEAMEGGVVRVWFGGGDVARPDERLNGQIGLGLLRIQ
jgi:predicted GH43/DUF377 family glycosyl hydrolase